MKQTAVRIVESHIEPTLLVDPSRQILAFNTAFADVIGLCRDEAFGLDFCSIVNVDEQDAHRIIRDCITCQSPLPVCLPLRPHDEMSCFVDCTGWGCEVEEGQVALLQLARTRDGLPHLLEQIDAMGELRRQSEARRRSEEALRMALQRLRDLEAIKDHMMAQISHDLRTPLNGILSVSQFLLDEPFGPMAPQYRGYVEDMMHSGSELLALVDKVLQLSSADQTGMHDRKVRADLNDCLRACLRVVEPMARAKELEIVVNPALRPVTVRAEGVVVKQVFYNLLNNAIVYSQNGGSVQVDGHWVGMDFAIQFVDSGEGIPEDELQRVLEPFYRTGDAYHAGPGGSGLGLALTKKSVELFGGRLLIESAPGLGTSATVILPVERRKLNSAGQRQGSAPERRRDGTG